MSKGISVLQCKYNILNGLKIWKYFLYDIAEQNIT